MHYDSKLGKRTDLIFGYLDPSPEGVARFQAAQRFAAILWWLAVGSVGYGLLGILVFRRNRCEAAIIATIVVLLSWLAATW